MSRDSKQTPSAKHAQQELEQLKSAHFNPEDREERIARGLRALQGPKPSINLSKSAWKQIAEDSEIEDT
jgi:hypothetical protein